MVRAAEAGRHRSALRIAVTIIVSSFLFQYVSAPVGAVWLIVVIGIELTGLRARQALLDGDLRFSALSIATMLATSLAWVAHAVLLWRTGEEVARIGAMMDLFTACLYAAIGALHDRRLLWALMTPPLVALCILLIGVLVEKAPPVMAAFATLATLGTCATIVFNAVALLASDRKLTAANHALAERAEEAQRANLAKDVFLSNMSHEIRTPLNGVIGLASILRETDLDVRQQEMADLIHTSGEMLERLLSDVLDLSKIEAGKFDVVRAPFELRSTVELAADLHRTSAVEKGVDFRLNFGAGADGVYEGDATRIRQIVSNLASNAVKFTQSGSITIEVEVAALAQADFELRLSVRDTGIGFDEAVASRLFRRFEQADGSITRNYGGTGLGLAICKEIVEALGGAIAVASRPGEGSVFSVTIPLAESDDTVTSADPAATEVVAAPLSGERLRVLLAEDHLVNQKVFGFMLDGLGVSSHLVENGAEALEAAKSGDFDIILLDMQMPVMDGLAAARGIRAFEIATGRARTPIALLSANAMPEHVEQALAAGCDLHLAKPITAERLLDGLNRALAIGQAGRGAGSA